MANEPPAPGSAVGHDGALVLALGLGVARAVDESRQVQAGPVHPGDRLPRDGHVAGNGRAELELGVPVAVLVVGVDPDEQFLLRRLGLLPVGGLVTGVRLEVRGNVIGQVRQQRGPEHDAEVHALALAVFSQVGQGAS